MSKTAPTDPNVVVAPAIAGLKAMRAGAAAAGVDLVLSPKTSSRDPRLPRAVQALFRIGYSTLEIAALFNEDESVIVSLYEKGDGS